MEENEDDGIEVFGLEEDIEAPNSTLHSNRVTSKVLRGDEDFVSTDSKKVKASPSKFARKTRGFMKRPISSSTIVQEKSSTEQQKRSKNTEDSAHHQNLFSTAMKHVAALS